LFYLIFLAIYYIIVKNKSWCFRLPANIKKKDLRKLNNDPEALDALVKCVRGIIDTASTTVSDIATETSKIADST
jgi:hypothetical protein